MQKNDYKKTFVYFYFSAIFSMFWLYTMLNIVIGYFSEDDEFGFAWIHT